MVDLIPKTKKGFILVVSAPSGAGKTSLCDKLAEDFPDYVNRSISMTTRFKRPAEENGKHYIFVGADEFNKIKAAQGFIETAEVFGEWYGTPRAPVEKTLKEGHVIVMAIDTKGAAAVRALFKKDCVTLFIMPPSLKELEN